MIKKCVLVVCFMVIASIAAFANADGADLSNNENARVYAVFFSISPDLSSEILSDLEKKCEAVEFVGKEIVNYDGKEASDYTTHEIFIPDRKSNSVLRNIERLKMDLDGVILFFGGFCDRRFMQTELPTIIVNCTPFNPSLKIGFKNAISLAERHRTKFITANYVSESVSAARLNDLVEKVKLFNVLRNMKNSKIIAVQDNDKINAHDSRTDAERFTPIEAYDLKYPKILEEHLGTEIVIVRSKELLREMGKFEEKEAEKIADMWEKDAKEIEVVKHHDLVRNAKLYLGFKALIKKYDADAITWDLLGSVVKALPPLSIMELSKEHIPASCQNHINGCITALVGRYMTEGGVGFMGDQLNDWHFIPVGDRPENVMIIGHGGAPITPHGDDRISYSIRNHFIKGHYKYITNGNTPTAIDVDFPTGEVASIVKFYIYTKKISIHTGTVLDGNALYEDFPHYGCNNKIVVQIDNPEDCFMLPSDPKEPMFRRSRIETFGSYNNQVVIYGDLRKKIKNFAKLIGFEVIEKDRGKGLHWTSH